MKVIKTNFEGLLILKPRIFEDNRGYFFESYNKNKLEENKIFYNFVQDNQSKSLYGVIRGLHYQIEPYAQTKLLRVLRGKILDVVVDIRKNSKTFGQHYSIELSDENKVQFLVPKGFAHGFSVLSEYAEVLYKCDNFYNSQYERALQYNDPKLGIDWRIDINNHIISEKDKKSPSFENCVKFNSTTNL